MIRVDTSGLKQAEKRIKQLKNKTRISAYRALSRVFQNAKTNATREIRQRYAIKAADVNSTFSIKRASRDDLRAVIRSKSRGVGLDKYRYSPKLTKGKRPRVLKAAVKKGSALKPIKGAFVADKNGVKIFIREGKKRLPIRRLYGPPAPEMFNNVEIRNMVEEKAHELYKQRLRHELDRELSK